MLFFVCHLIRDVLRVNGRTRGLSWMNSRCFPWSVLIADGTTFAHSISISANVVCGKAVSYGCEYWMPRRYLQLSTGCAPCTCRDAGGVADSRPELNRCSVEGRERARRRPHWNPTSARPHARESEKRENIDLEFQSAVKNLFFFFMHSCDWNKKIYKTLLYVRHQYF